MMFSKFFIERPVFASVVAIIISLAGGIGLASLPVEQYPTLTPPTVSVSATYSGADAKTIAETVAIPIEDAINGVENMIYLESTSSTSGQMRLTAYFDIGTDPNQATVNINNRISSATAKLPENVRKLGVTVRNSNSSILEIISLYSDDGSMDAVDIYNYISLNVLDDIKRVPGVGDAFAIGEKNYSMRVWLDPTLLNKFQITAKEVLAAIREQNAQYATGKIGEEPVAEKSPFVYSITMQGRLQNSQEFGNVILRVNEDGSFLRLKDVAQIELGSQKYSSQGRFNGKEAVPIIINLQSGANSINTAKLIDEKMKELAKNFPQGLQYAVPYDTTTFVKASISEVIKTFVEALILVVIVMYMFLKNFRATLIPMIAVPVSLLGTFAGLYLLGFSINLLTLFALILAIGIVVDDAIIVVENVDRILHDDPTISVKDATIAAMGEVFSPVISIVLVLCAVFIPVSFISGFIGEIQKQFALTLAISVTISGFVALTLTPALCALFLKRTTKEPFLIVKKFNDFFDRSTSVFSAGVAYILRRILRFVLLFALMLAATIYLFLSVPKSLVPQEDQGMVMSIINLPAAASLHRTVEFIDSMAKNDIAQLNGVDSSVSLIGFDLFTSSPKENTGALFIRLKDWADRNVSSFELVKNLNAKYFLNPTAQSYFLDPPAIPGLSITGGFEMYLQNRSGKSYEAIQEDVNKLILAANARKELVGVRTTLDTNFPQLKLEINRDKLKLYGLNLEDVFTTINATLGTYYVNDFSLLGKNFQVNVRAKGDFRNTGEALKNIFVKSNDGKMIALDSILTLKNSAGPDDVKRFNLFPAAQVQGSPAPGYSSGQAMAVMEELVGENLGEDYTLAWSGTSYQEATNTNTGTVAFVLGMIFVFLILAAQYERWLMPLAVITAVPFALFGSLLFIWARDFYNDVYFQTGLLLLVGLSAKNAILIVEFAMEAHLRGKSIFEASVEAAKLRFRPIVMTSLAFTLGILPLVLSSGAGSAARHALGTGLIGGMLAASTLAIFFVPLFFYLLESLNAWIDKKRSGANA